MPELRLSIFILGMFVQSVYGYVKVDPEKVDSVLLYALELTESGKPNDSANVLNNLLQNIQTQRIWLEYGRALFLAGRYKEASDVFGYFLSRYPDAPNRVIRNVDSFISEMEKRRFLISPIYDLGYDDNPYQISETDKVFLFGNIPYEYEPDEDKKKGRSFAVGGLRSSGSNLTGTSWGLSVKLKDYPSSALDQQFYSSRLKHTFYGSDLLQPSVGLKVERSENHFGSSHWSVEQFVGIAALPFTRFSSAVSAYKTNTYFDAASKHSGKLSGIEFRQNLPLSSAIFSLELKHEKNRSPWLSDAYTNQNMMIDWINPLGLSNSSLSFGYGQRKYLGDQAPFYKVREDLSSILSVSKTLAMRTLIDNPIQLRITKTSRNSTISLFDTTQIQVQVRLVF